MSGPRSISLPACLLASIVLHAAATAVIAVRQDATPASAASSNRPQEADEPVLGDAAGSAASINWIGFESPDRHIAPESEVTQAALALNAGRLAPPAATSPPAEAQSQPAPDATQQPPAAAEAPAAAAIRVDPTESPDVPVSIADDHPLAPLLSQIRAAIAAQSMPEPLVAAPAAPAPAEAEPLPRPPATPPGALADPGAPSDREAAAASREPVAEVRLQSGHVVSAAGLEITTRRPRFETLTRLTSSPRNPVVRISFSRLGRVTNVELLESSTFAAVDDPVVTAVYNWTAKGEPLLKLRQDDPDAAVKVVIRILLR